MSIQSRVVSVWHLLMNDMPIISLGVGPRNHS